MLDGYARGLTLAAAIGAGITTGVYFAFSTFVMTGLRRLSHAQSIAAMNAINKAAPNPLFMLALFGTAIACLVLAVHGLRNRDAATVWLIVGCALYLISALARMPPERAPRGRTSSRRGWRGTTFGRRRRWPAR